ncbi:MAG: Hsp33 family molecular chaperone HslO [Verrucomicrobiota bacterium]
MEVSPEESSLEVRTYFVRGRNALVARAELGDLYIDYYLHQGQNGYQHKPQDDGMMKEALAAMVLHAASKPRTETVAWTVHFEDPLINLFVTAENPYGRIVGQIFTDNVKRLNRNMFCSDLVCGTDAPRRSVVDFDGADVLKSVERFYESSEQRLARFFEIAPEEFVLISAQPDCDEEWLAELTVEMVQELDRREELGLLEDRLYRWECGCNQARMLAVLAPVMRMDAEGLFGDESLVRIGCPRCGAKHTITRESLEAFVANRVR